MTARARPPFDVELESALGAVPAFFTTLEPDSIAEFRAATTRPSSLDEVIAGRPVEVTDHAVTVLRRGGHDGAAGPGVYLIHGRGMVGGSRWAVVPMLVEWVLEYGPSRPPWSTVSHPSSLTRCPSRTVTQGSSGSPALLMCSTSTRDRC
jgi:hypothetical protein